MKTFKIVLLIAALILIAVGIPKLISHYRDYETQNEEYYLNDTREMVWFHSGKVRLKNAITDQYISPKLDYVFLNSTYPVTVYKLKNKRGYINQETGDIIIDSRKHNFSYAWEFDPQSGMAAVVEDGKLGFIDASGSYKIRPQFTYSFTVNQHLGFLFKNGFSLVPGGNGNVGIIDTKGKMILGPVYSNISDEDYHKLRVVFKSETNKYGIINSEFLLVLPVAYDKIELTGAGIILSENHRKRLVSYNDYGKVITQQIWDEVEPLYYQQTGSTFENCSEVFSGFYRVVINDKSGVVDTRGELRINPEWNEIKCLNPSLFGVTVDNHQLLLNADGQFID